MPCRAPHARPDADAGPPAGPLGAARIVRARGFTLLEILIALVVLGVALTGLLQLEALGVRLRSQAQELTVATFLLQSRMADVELAALERFPDLGTTDGDFGETYPGYRWEMTVVETPFPIVREVRVRVLWRTGAREEHLELTNYVVEPGK